MNNMDNVPFPRFSSDYYSIWFAQMEAAFDANSVEEIDRYAYVLNYIPTPALTLVEDILVNPPEVDRYENFKYEFIKRLTVQQLKSLPFNIGKEKPSEYLRKLTTIAGRRIANEVILNIWQNSLPERVRHILSLETTRNMDRLSEMADKVMALYIQPQVVVRHSSCDKQFGVFMQRMDAIEKQMQLLQRIVDGEHIELEDSQPVQDLEVFK